MKTENNNSDKHDVVNDSTEMAVDRTVMAADRSLMAWVRTGTFPFSFGFTIYKFLDYSASSLLQQARISMAFRVLNLLACT